MIANAKDFTIIARHGHLAVAKKHVGRGGYTVIEMSGRTMVMDLAHRATEAQARAKANELWLKAHRPTPMTPEQLDRWLAHRGVADAAQRERLVAEYAGSTEDKMDELYDAVCGRMA